MPRAFRIFVLSTTAAVLAGPAKAGDDRLGIRPGMGIAEIRQNLKDRCDDLNGNPYVTCIRGTTVITATLSAKDRAYYIARWEVSPLPREKYAEQVATELGFAGSGEDCSDDGEATRCWHGDDGTRLFAAEADMSTNAPKDRYMILLVNERIKNEDGAP